MKKLMLVVTLFGISLLATGADKKCSLLSNCQAQIMHQLDVVEKATSIDAQIRDEFLDMSLELSKLHNEEVNAIMRPRIEKIKELQKQKQALQ